LAKPMSEDRALPVRARGVGALRTKVSRPPHLIVGFAYPCNGAKRPSEQSEREVGCRLRGETPPALPMEGALLTPIYGAKRPSEQSEREGEAPLALPMEGATRAPIN